MICLDKKRLILLYSAVVFDTTNLKLINSPRKQFGGGVFFCSFFLTLEIHCSIVLND